MRNRRVIAVRAGVAAAALVFNSCQEPSNLKVTGLTTGEIIIGSASSHWGG